MIVGFDYWNVISHYPKEMGTLIFALYQMAVLPGEPDTELHVISAIGEGRRGTIEQEVFDKLLDAGFESDILLTGVHEVITSREHKSPELKLAKCKELGIEMFFDDRGDVCDLLNANGILAFQVPRKSRTSDVKGERK